MTGAGLCIGRNKKNKTNTLLLCKVVKRVIERAHEQIKGELFTSDNCVQGIGGRSGCRAKRD